MHTRTLPANNLSTCNSGGCTHTHTHTRGNGQDRQTRGGTSLRIAEPIVTTTFLRQNVLTLTLPAQQKTDDLQLPCSLTYPEVMGRGGGGGGGGPTTVIARFRRAAAAGATALVRERRGCSDLRRRTEGEGGTGAGGRGRGRKEQRSNGQCAGSSNELFCSRLNGL